MPRTVRGETRTLHAAWWSPEKNGSDEWVEHCVIKRFSFADRQHLSARLLRIVGTEGAEALRNRTTSQISEEDLSAIFLTRLLIGIESMTDEQGNPLPVTEEVVSSLDQRDGQFILDAIHELNPQLQETEEQRTSFPR